MTKRLGLRLYLAIAFAIIATATGAAFALLAGSVLVDTMRQRIGSVIVRGGFEAVELIDREIRERQDDLNNYATMVRHAGAIGLADVEWIGVDSLTREDERAFGCDWAAATDLSGRVIASSRNGPQIGSSLGDRAWFAGARDGETLHDMAVTSPTGRTLPRMIIARPLRDRSQNAFAVVVCDLEPVWSLKLAERVAADLPGVTENTDLLVVNRAGEPILTTRAVTDTRLPDGLFNREGPSGSAWSEIPWPNGVVYVTSVTQVGGASPVAQLGWRVVVRRSAADLMNPIIGVRNRIYEWGAVLILVAAALGALAAHRILTPMRRIADAARRIGEGELGVHIPEFSTYREGETLSASLRTMLASLRANEARLAALNETLDQRVRQRTAEIAETHEALARQESRLRAVIETATDGVLIVGEADRIETFNPACQRIFGWTAVEVIGLPVSELIASESRSRRGGVPGFDEMISPVPGAPAMPGHAHTVRGRRRDGTTFPLEVSLSRTMIQGSPVYVAIVRDVTEAVRAHDKLFAQATKDALTGLRNRRYFLEGADTEFARARRNGRAFSLLLIDADHFKQINDQFGHETGDRVLRSISDICQHSLREVDMVGRLGGEEFAVAMPEVEIETASLVAERLRHQVSECEVVTAESNVRVTVSIGVAAAMPEDQTLNQMLRRADQALYAAKNEGRNRVSVARPAGPVSAHSESARAG